MQKDSIGVRFHLSSTVKLMCILFEAFKETKVCDSNCIVYAEFSVNVHSSLWHHVFV